MTTTERQMHQNTSNDSERKKASFWDEVKAEAQDLLFIALGVLSACFGLNSLLIPNDFIDGGITGISLIANALSDLPLSVFIAFINLPFIVLAFTAINRRFAIKSIIGIAIFALAVHWLHFPTITDEKILVSVFGGFFLGLGIGLAMRGGSILDGTEVLAIYISRNSSLSVGSIILLFNIVIFSTAAYVFNIEIALYAILTYFSASRTVDFVIDGIEEYMGVTIITEASEEMRLAITNNMRRACTIYKGQSGYSKNGEELKDIRIVYTVITRLEMSKLKAEINKVDKNAFVIMNSIKDTKGGMIKKKPIAKLK